MPRRIGYLSIGSRPGLVLVPRREPARVPLRGLARELSVGYRVTGIDRRGRGDRGPRGPGYGVDSEVDDVDAVLERTGAGTVFGHSYGRLVALHLSLRRDLGAAGTRGHARRPGTSPGVLPQQVTVVPASRCRILDGLDLNAPQVTARQIVTFRPAEEPEKVGGAGQKTAPGVSARRARCRLDWAGAPRAGWLSRIRWAAVAVSAMRVQQDNG